MKKHNRNRGFHLVAIPLGGRECWFVSEGLYKWLMQHRYKCDWRGPYKRTEKRSKKG